MFIIHRLKFKRMVSITNIKTIYQGEICCVFKSQMKDLENKS